VHAHTLEEVTLVLDFEYGAEPCFERRQPSSIITGSGNAVNVEGVHGEKCPGAEYVDARVRDAMLPPIIYKSVPYEDVELAGGYFSP
jgi:hypothetical protein